MGLRAYGTSIVAPLALVSVVPLAPLLLSAMSLAEKARSGNSALIGDWRILASKGLFVRIFSPISHDPPADCFQNSRL